MDLEVIRRLVIEGKTIGVDQAVAQLKQLSGVYEGVAVSSVKTEGASLSVSRGLQGLESRLDPVSRATRQLARDTELLGKAFDQGAVSAARHNELLGLATASAIRMGEGTKAVTEATGVWGAFTKATSGVTGQILALSAGAGPVGVFLSSLGPLGLTAAVGLGAVGAAFRFVEQESARMGDKAISVRAFAESTGLGAAQMKGLRHEAAEFGLDGEAVASAFEKLTFKLDEARQASGTLFNEVREVSGGLAKQLTQTDTTAQGIDVLARAYHEAGNEAQKMVISRAAFGRQGVVAGPVLGKIAEAGGIDELAKSTKGLTEATDAQNKEWARMRAETVEMEKQAKNILASIFTQEGLEASHKAAELLRDAAKATKDLAAQKEGLSGFQRLILDITNAEQMPGLIPTPAGRSEAIAADAAKQRITQGTGSNLGAKPEDIDSWGKLSDAMNGIVSPAQQAEASLKKLQDAASASANLEKERVGLLGAAATADEQRKAKLTELTAAFLQNKMSAEDYGRAVDTANHAASALTATHQAAIQTLQARTAAERQAAASATVRAGDGSGDAGLRAQQAVTMEIARQAQAHRDAMAAMQGQLGVAGAVTGAQRMAAEEAANYARLINEGRNSQQAAAEAAKQTQIAQAQANATVAQQITSLDQQTELIKARLNGTEATVIAEQAYKNAVDAGASSLKAAELESATFENQRAQAAEKEAQRNQQGREKAALQDQRAADSRQSANQQVDQQISSLKDQTELLRAGSGALADELKGQQAFNKAIADGADLLHAIALEEAVIENEQAKRHKAMGPQISDAPGSQILTQQEQWNKAHGIDTTRVPDPTSPWGVRLDSKQTQQSLTDVIDKILSSGGSYVDAINQLQNMPANKGGVTLDPQLKTSTIMDLLQRLGDQDKGAAIPAIQQELALLRQQPHTLANDASIKQLTDQLDQLTKATESSTKSQEMLSGLYSRQFGQGFYDGGAAVGEKIYGLDNNTGAAIEAMQRSATDNARTAGDLQRGLSQNEITSLQFVGAGIEAATNAVQGQLRSGVADIVRAIQTGTAVSPPPPTVPLKKLPGFAAGGSFTTAGYGEDDSNVVAFRVSPQRERVTVTKLNEAAPGGGNDNRRVDITNINNFNVPADTNEFRSAAAHAGESIAVSIASSMRRR